MLANPVLGAQSPAKHRADQLDSIGLILMMSSQDKSECPMFETLNEAYAWLDSHINYEKKLDLIADPDGSFKLDPIRRLLRDLGNPHREGLSIHIAGSRGKGSSALALEAILASSGLRVATFTSPHINEYRERIRINRQAIEPREFTESLRDVAQAYRREVEKPDSFKTVFELLTATFFQSARRAAADILIIETGLGGRLDCTNIIDPGAVLLTRIGLEHTHILGDTIEAIAREKAAVLKPGGWGVATRQGGSEAMKVFEARAGETDAPLIRAADCVPLLRETYTEDGMNLVFDLEGEKLSLELRLFGPFFPENLQGVLALYLEMAQRHLIPRLTVETIVSALTEMRLPGRMEPLPIPGSQDVRLFVDGAHCPTGASAVARAMQAHFGTRQASAVVGMMADKDHAGFFQALAGWPRWKRVYTFQLASTPRAAPASLIAEAARPFFPEVEVCPNIQTALRLALDQAEDREMIIALGSIFSIGSVSEWSRCYGRT